MNLIPISFLLVVFSWALPAAAQESVSNSAKTIKATVAATTKHHLKPPSIDQTFCKRWLKRYLDTLDPSKLYFLTTDISEFEKYVSKMPKFARDGDTELLELVSKRYQLRAESALKHALDRIDRPFDFTLNENIPFQYAESPKTDKDRIERWRLQLKYALLIERSQGNRHKDQIEFLKSRYESIRKQVQDQTQQQKVTVYLDSFCRTVDPHSGYINQKEFSTLFGGLIKRYSIGLRRSQDRGRTIIQGFAPEFTRERGVSKIVGCELLAIRSKDGGVHNCREIFSSTTNYLVEFGLDQDDSVTLELYDETKLLRFAINWPRK